MFGTDPEAFIFKEYKIDKQLGKIPNIIPPIALVEDFGAKYTNRNGKKVLLYNEEFQWSEDGAAIELQMNPTNDKIEFWNRLAIAKDELRKFLQKYELSMTMNTPIGFFSTKKYWEDRNEEFQSCVIFGCDPDMFPYHYVEIGLDKLGNNKTLDVSKHPYRYGGGHIHIQAPNKDPEIYMKNWEQAAIIFDFFAGLSHVLNSTSQIITLQEKFRLKYYGKPGRIRLQKYSTNPKIYGIEYRVLPNTWTTDNQKTYKLLSCLDISADLIEKNKAKDFLYDFEKDIPKMHAAITTLNKRTAKILYERCIEWLLIQKLLSPNQLENLI